MAMVSTTTAKRTLTVSMAEHANTPTPTRKPLRMAGSRRAVDVKTPRQANIEVMKNMQVMEARRLSASHRSRELRG